MRRFDWWVKVAAWACLLAVGATLLFALGFSTAAAIQATFGH